MKQIEHLLQTSIGLNAGSIGSSSIQRSVRLRMKSLGIHEIDDYRKLVTSSASEWQELVESVVVTETWFFRERRSFEALVRLVNNGDLTRFHPGRIFRILSLPCSSGEEPYSIVMALCDAGINPNRFQIDAADISERALTKARRGVYRKNSFRGQDFGFRARYFQHTKDGFVLDAAIREKVKFCEGNVLSDDFPLREGGYDFIFCRNLLIYLDLSTQTKTLHRVAALLAPSGVLFVGSAEMPLALEHSFVAANLPMAFACRKDEGSNTILTQELTGQWTALAKSETAQAGTQTNFEQIAPVPLHSSSAAQDDLTMARQLADAGRLGEASGICEGHLRENGPSAQAFYLLGLVREASGDSATAMDCYRKALYLEPNHYESLLQMALLSQKHGDAARARNFRVRAERVNGGHLRLVTDSILPGASMLNIARLSDHPQPRPEI